MRRLTPVFARGPTSFRGHDVEVPLTPAVTRPSRKSQDARSAGAVNARRPRVSAVEAQVQGEEH